MDSSSGSQTPASGSSPQAPVEGGSSPIGPSRESNSQGSPVSSERPGTPALVIPRRAGSATKWRGGRLYAVATAIIAIIVVVAAIAIAEGLHRNSKPASVTVVAPVQSVYLIPVGQFNSIVVNVNASSVLSGSLKTSYGVVLYRMTNQQFETYVRSNIVNYTWTSGPVAPLTIYQFSISLPIGPSTVVFADPSTTEDTAVVLASNLTLSTA